jgi:hypothetical protein
MCTRSHLGHGDDAERVQRLLDRAHGAGAAHQDVDVAARIAEVVLAPQDRPLHPGAFERPGGLGDQRVQAVHTVRGATTQVGRKPPGAGLRVDFRLLSHVSMQRLTTCTGR